MYREQAYENYLAFKANSISNDIGNLALGAVFMGVVSTPETSTFTPKAEVNHAPAPESYDRIRSELGIITARNLVTVASPKEMLTYTRDKLDLAA